MCCHPDDWEEMFPAVAKEIWSICDVALCYDADPYSTTDEEEFLSDLGDMRMVAIVVTHRFLTENSQAKDVIMPFFASRRIPLLPLVREPNLDRQFAQVMGDIQYLAIPSQNSTELPYEERLRTFFLKIMPGGHDMDKIHQAFRSRVFLSYRKVDRKDARELIQFVHGIDECRDVAIWYDDFLTFGENFNTEIAEAIKKSDFFAMAITPNIVKDENYVIRREYPLAWEEKKCILPIEMHVTDRAQLRESFHSIPDCVSYGDAKTLTDVLRVTLTPTVGGKRDPEHDYWLGLAYLNGIDVETNVALGFSLIRSAAEAGVVDACEKLVDMYWLGDGTSMDREEALLQQEKLIVLLKGRQERSGQSDDTLAYARALYRKATYLCEMRRYADALPYAKKARALVDDLCISSKDNPYGILLSKYALLCSEIHFRLHHGGRGLVYLVESFAYMDFNTDSTNGVTTDTKRQIVSLGLTFCNADDDLSWKADDINTVVDLAKMVYEESGLEFDKEQYVRCLLWGISRIEDKTKVLVLAERVIELLAVPEDVNLSEIMQNYLAQAYMWIGLNAEDDDQKREYMDKVLDISMKHPESSRHREAVVSARTVLAKLYKAEGKTEQSRTMCRQALTDIRALAQETQNISHYKMLIFLEAMENEEISNDSLKELKFEMDRWRTISKQHQGDAGFRKEYVLAKRVYYAIRVLSCFGFFKNKMK